MIRVESLSRIYPATAKSVAVTALKDVDIAVRRGEIYGVIGRSGAGKSTLLRAVNGLERPTSGRVLVDGVDIGALTDSDLRAERRKIGMIFQHFNLLSSRTAYDNVALPLEFAGVDRAVIRPRVEALLDLVGLSDKRDRYPVELSGGQKQRVGIARALATEPKVLLSDEATSALDPETTRSILALLAEINRTLGVTIMLITHEMAVVKDVATRVGVMEDGLLIEEGDVYDVVTRPRTDTARSFLGTLAGREIPPGLAARLRPSPEGTTTALIRLGFTGSRSTEPVISRLSRELGLDVAVLQGQVDEIGGRPFGTLIVSLPNAALADGSAERFLAHYDVATERLGHVA
ncbi:methionine ABC transporter ATP-binding protein [Siculibacillus lacustris]|uniref:Cell division ATP-binding protein FtsE n=1 Tax=Siculibacillus lacustris TaxID=1549641 RepID=A0A4Q9VVY6_9HYPH|nr:methionine ABC transporter ATP-binding protein [Siculibacillus lacustris]TBW40350.1 methionine ABC transporter ATP-binding protein [Siculibacillus lacustris]